MRRHGCVGAIVGATLAADSLFYTAILPILGRLSHEYHLTESQSGIIVGAYAGAMVLAAYPAAKFVVHFRGRASVIAGLGLMSLGCLIFAFSGSLWILVLARAVQGVGGTLSWTGGLAWLAETTPRDRRGKVLGTALGLGVVGSQLGPAVGALAATVGQAPAFSIGTLVGLCLAGWAWVAKGTPVDPVALTAHPGMSRDARFRTGLWLSALPSLCLGVIDVLGPLRLSALRETPVVIGAVFFVAAGLLALVSRLTGQAIDRSGNQLPIRVALTGSVGIMILLATTSHQGSLVPGIVLGSALLGSLWGPGMNLLADAARRHGVDEGYAFAGFLFAWAVGFATGSTMSGVLAHAGGEALPYGLGAALCVMTVPVGLHAAWTGSSRSLAGGSG